MTEIIFASATRLAKAIQDKVVSSEEVVNAYLERIEEVKAVWSLDHDPKTAWR